MRYFVYGTLLDADVRRAVLGKAVVRLHLRPATLKGFRRVAAPGRCYPTLRPDPRGQVDGAVLDGVTPAMAERLARYEGEEYRVIRHRVKVAGASLEALVFVPRAGRPPAGPTWDLIRWQTRHKRSFLREIAGASLRN